MDQNCSIKKSGLTSVTFRKLGAERIIALAKEAALNGIEWGGDIHVPAGNVRIAEEVRQRTVDAGLEVFSYGSYFTAGEGEAYRKTFETVLKTAVSLGAGVVRIWTKRQPSVKMSIEAYTALAAELKVVAKMAAQENVVLGMEYHNGTANDSAESCLRLLGLADEPNLTTYWQPLYHFEQNISDIRALKGRIQNAHIYNWIYKSEGNIRKMLCENVSDFEAYVKELGGINYILEFVKDDDITNFFEDAKVLNRILGR